MPLQPFVSTLLSAHHMPSRILHEQAAAFKRPIPDIRSGYTVRVSERILEGGKERLQAFEGLVIAVHRGHVPTDASFTVRCVMSGIGVEKVFPFCATSIAKVEVKKVAETRRAKLTFLRGRAGRAARLNERFTTSEEFGVTVATAPKEEDAKTAEKEALSAES